MSVRPPYWNYRTGEKENGADLTPAPAENLLAIKAANLSALIEN